MMDEREAFLYWGILIYGGVCTLHALIIRGCLLHRGEWEYEDL